MIQPLVAVDRDGREQASGMKRATLLTILLASTLAFGQKVAQKFEVSDLSASDSPISFSGTTKILKTGTACVVTAHNNSSQSLLAVRATVDAATRYAWDQSVEFEYDGFFKEYGISPGMDFDVVNEGMYSGEERVYVNGVLVDPPPPNFACHAKAKVEFIQLADGSTWGDYQTKKDVIAERAKNMAILTHLVDAYDTGGQTAFDAALNEPESREETAPYYKTTMIDLAKKRLAAGQKRQAAGIF
jgi:hypothetical protein